MGDVFAVGVGMTRPLGTNAAASTLGRTLSWQLWKTPDLKSGRSTRSTPATSTAGAVAGERIGAAVGLAGVPTIQPRTPARVGRLPSSRQRMDPVGQVDCVAIVGFEKCRRCRA